MCTGDVGGLKKKKCKVIKRGKKVAGGGTVGTLRGKKERGG